MDNIQNRKIVILCLASAFANAALSFIISGLLRIPLYADTVFTAAMCFTAGMFAGIVTGALFSPLFFFLVFKFILNEPLDVALLRNVFIICIIAEVFLINYFHKKIIKPHESAFSEKHAGKQNLLSAFIPVTVRLLLLVVLDCVVISVLGGILEFIIELFSVPWKFSPSDIFKLGLLRFNAPVLAAGILSQIPINIVDRFIVIFGGYGISLVFRKWLSASPAKPEKITAL